LLIRRERLLGVPLPLAYYFVASVVFWFCCTAAMLFWRQIKHWPYPYRSPLMPAPLCRDIWWCSEQFAHLHSPQFFTSRGLELYAYPPGTALPFAFFQNVLPHFHSIPFLGLTFLGVAALGTAFAKGLIQLGVERWRAALVTACAFVLMFPFTFVWTTGNIEIVLYLALSSGVLAFLRGRFTVAAVLFGFCASMKFYPFVMLALFLPFRRYKEIAIGAGSFVLSSLAGLWLLCPNLQIAYQELGKSLRANRVAYMESFLIPQSAADHSIWGLIKTLWFLHSRRLHFPSWTVSAYTATMAVIGISLYFGRIRKLPLLNQIVCLYLCLLLMVPESFEYTLVHVSVVWALLVLYMWQRAQNGLRVSHLTPVFVYLAFILSVQNELIYRHGFWGQAKCIVLLLLLGTALVQPWDGLENSDWVTRLLRQRQVTEFADA